MKKSSLAYFIACFFIMLFACKAVLSVFPALLNDKATVSVEKMICAETENEKKTGEERAEQDVKEIYFNNENTIDLSAIVLPFIQQVIQANNIQHKQAVYISIPTPPPEA